MLPHCPVFAGDYSCKLTATAGGDWTSIDQEITLTPGNKCKVTIWCLRPAHASSKLRLYIQTGAGWTLTLISDATWATGVAYIDLPETAVWLKYELEFTAHPDYSDYRIKFYKSHVAGGAISYYIDSVSLGEFRNLSLGVGEGGNFLEEASISLGGAGKTPDPVAGSWDATLLNEDSVFHPEHPTSVYKDWLKTQRQVKISVGARYGGVDYYWPRLIGYMDVPKFSVPDYKVNISGGDYMKLLQETELRSPDNYWGSSQTFSSIASDGVVGAEIYAEGDAMEIGGGEADNVTNWATSNVTFVSLADVGGGSDFVGKVTGQGLRPRWIKNVDVGSAVAGQRYQVKFKHRIVGGTGINGIRIRIDQASGRCIHMIYFPTDDWTEETFYFTALDTGAIQWWMRFSPIAADIRLDDFSISGFTPYYERYYELPGASKGPYYLTLDGDPVWPNEEDEGWFYVEDAEAGPDPPAHPAKIVFFDPNKTVANGNNNLVIYYFTTESPENAVADILVKVGLYVDQAAALAAMDFDATGVTIDKIWFKPGSTCLNAIKKLCERCNYRFHFKYDGTPVFKPAPTAGGQAFTFLDPKQLSSVETYQDQNEIKNRVIIEGMKQADPVSEEEKIPPELRGMVSDATSIAAYGERTLTIKNHLFQTQAAIDAMCATKLAEYKDPKWYSDIEVPFNPAPIEMGDTIGWEERLSPILDISQEGIVRDIKINNFNTTYVCELT